MIPIKDDIPTDGIPFVTLALILANAVIYVLAVSHGGSLISGPDAHVIVKYGAIPYALTHPGSGIPAGGLPTWETPFTAMFIHASILHLAGNMLFLWILGNTVERAMGSLQFVGFYLIGGLATLALEVIVSPNSTAATVGASGAIAAVVGGYIVLYPRARVLTLVVIPLLFTVIEVPVMVMLGLWFALQAVFAATGLATTGGDGGVAYAAQVGGFVLGAVAIRALASRRRVAA